MEYKNLSSSEIGRLRQRLLNNLANEGFIKLQRDPVTEEYASPTSEILEDLILRNYDSYAIAATSLLCQLLNLEKFQRVELKELEKPYCYLDFYDKCFHLRNFLARSDREIEDTPKFNALKQVFDKCWDHLLEYVETHETKDFLELLSPNPTADRGDSCLTPRGIYKRIRNLNHTLWQQRAPAHLEWDLGRFDLLGCRLNCLYKNQVFAAYEQLWNSGDPFWGMITERKGRERMTESEFIQDRLRGRQRWLCLRTNYFEGDYYALQIAALVDPNAIHEGFWEKQGYNLKRVQYLLGRLFDEFDAAGADKYKSLARVRHHLRWEYVDWYEAAVEVVRTKSATPRPHDDSVGFGSFLGEAAVDCLMECIDKYRKKKQVHENLEALNSPAADRIDLVNLREQVKAIWDALHKPLVEILRCGQVYTEKVLDLLTRLEKKELPFKIGGDDKLNITHFSQQAEKLYTAVRGTNGYGEGDARRRLDIIDKEWNYFNGCFCLGEDSQNGSIKSASPIIFIQDAQLVENLSTFSIPPDPNAPDRRAGDLSTEAGQHNPSAPPSRRAQDGFDARISRLYADLASLRREQKGFLFYRRARGTEDRPGLSLRDTENVFHRIQNYVLLYDRRDNPELRSRKDSNTTKEEMAGLFRGWTSYGLFYYLRSLIPLEIQVRTMLADTLAEQYHDVVYKGAPPKGTEFPRRLMEKIAEELDDLDKEMEIDFEDYINRRRQAGE